MWHLVYWECFARIEAHTWPSKNPWSPGHSPSEETQELNNKLNPATFRKEDRCCPRRKALWTKWIIYLTLTHLIKVKWSHAGIHKILSPSWSCFWSSFLALHDNTFWKRMNPYILHLATGKIAGLIALFSHASEQSTFLLEKQNSNPREGKVKPLLYHFLEHLYRVRKQN